MQVFRGINTVRLAADAFMKKPCVIAFRTTGEAALGGAIGATINQETAMAGTVIVPLGSKCLEDSFRLVGTGANAARKKATQDIQTTWNFVTESFQKAPGT
jgi:hypothetical protein